MSTAKQTSLPLITNILKRLHAHEAAPVLQLFPHDFQTDILQSLVNQDSFEDKSFKTHNTSHLTLEKTGLIVEHMMTDNKRSLLKHLKNNHPSLHGKIKAWVYLFDELVKLEDKDLQLLLNKVLQREEKHKLLVNALKNMSDSFLNHIFDNVSGRIATLIKEDMDYSGAVGVKVIHSSQKCIMDEAKAMEQAGLITIKNLSHHIDVIVELIYNLGPLFDRLEAKGTQAIDSFLNQVTHHDLAVAIRFGERNLKDKVSKHLLIDATTTNEVKNYNFRISYMAIRRCEQELKLLLLPGN